MKHVKPNDWQQPIPKGYTMVCCDCGLVHRIDFRVVKVIKTYKNGSMLVETVPSNKYRAQFRARRARKQNV